MRSVRLFAALPSGPWSETQCWYGWTRFVPHPKGQDGCQSGPLFTPLSFKGYVRISRTVSFFLFSLCPSGGLFWYPPSPTQSSSFPSSVLQGVCSGFQDSRFLSALLCPLRGMLWFPGLPVSFCTPLSSKGYASDFQDSRFLSALLCPLRGMLWFPGLPVSFCTPLSFKGYALISRTPGFFLHSSVL